MLRAIAIDDDKPALTVIENFSAQTDKLQLVRTFSKPEEALTYLRKFPVDLLFLDIHMPTVSGLDFYKSLQQELMVVFTTAHKDYAVDGFNVQAVDFLLKPFTIDRFRTAVEKANEKYELGRNKPGFGDDALFIRADYKLIRIPQNEIIYIEGLDDYLKIHLNNSKPVVARMTMKTIMDKLNAKEFVRIHRSYIVPMNRINAVRNKMIFLNDTELPIGTTYEQQFLEVFNKTRES